MRVSAHPGLTVKVPAHSVALTRRRWLQSTLVQGGGHLVLGSVALLGTTHVTAAIEPSFYDSFTGMRLLDQNGRSIQLNDLRGKVVLFNFIFTACSTVCPVQTHALAQMLESMAPDIRRGVHLVSVSLDPLGDTPKALKAFAQRFKADSQNWSFVTGRPQDIHRLAESLWLFQNGKGKAALETHNTSLWIIDPQGAVRVRYGGNPPDVQRLSRELGALAASSAPTLVGKPP